MRYILNPFKQIYDINGKASLKEFWYFFLFTWLVLYPLWVVFRGQFEFNRELNFWVRILLSLPLITLGFRRLNDAGYNKWLFLIPIAGVLLATTPQDNKAEEDLGLQ